MMGKIKPRIIFNSCRFQSGFSLVELMVALVIGLVIVAAAFQVFFSGSQSFSQVRSLNERQEIVRYLVDSLSYEIRSADSFSISSDSDGLTVQHVGRPGSSICSSEVNYSISYYSSGGEIVLDPSCSAGGAIVLGVGEIEFSYLPSGFGVFVTVELIDSEGTLEDQVLSFTVANRSRVSETIEFGGGT